MTQRQSPVFVAFKASIPVFFAYFPLGIVYGLLFTQHGNPWFFAPLFSLFICAGAMQFLALTLLMGDASFFLIAVSLIPLGIRNIFYGLTLTERYRPISPILRAYLAFGLVDATYSLIQTGPRFEEKQDRQYLLSLTAWNHSYWVAGTLFGTVADKLFAIPQGLDFLLTAFFAAVATEQLVKKKDIKAVVIACVSLSIAIFWMPGHLFLGSVGIAMTACLALPSKKEEEII